jgi:hypothetical protein
MEGGEAVMVRTASEKKTGSSWMMWAFWAAGVSLLLVEVKAAMEYLEAGLRQNLAGLLGDVPAMGMITLNVAEHSLWNWGSLQWALQTVPMVATGLLLVTVAVMLNRRTAR